MKTATESERVVFEGASDSFTQEIEDWLRDNAAAEQIERIGSSVTATVTAPALAKIRTLLRARQGPKHMYRAFLSSETSGGMPEIIQGSAYRTETILRDGASGRHVLLSALPSELAARSPKRARSRSSK